ncbi:MAG: hypothetical protein R2686_06945 [Candidatus Nanopelagicales bacterium]
MAAASNLHRTAAVMRALDLDSRMPPNARLWLALASAKTDDKGRTKFGPDAYGIAANDSPTNGNSAIVWLTSAGIVLNDTDDDGIECWRLTHHEWDRDHDVIRGYSRDAGQKRDGLPPQYGRSPSDVIEPNGQAYAPPPAADVHWSELVTEPAEETP